ncbi:MAG: DNA topoisomerase IV [Deltaproteobacteria bacterium RIFOXYD12_FULL_57_12]|nr:MAG: DNA topoisomerase IV [Deltaproteobacteria bacterium RIFOXYD12_FULL_57_12]
MELPEQVGKLHQLFDRNFMEYTSYVIKERAIPDINDGLKPVQRRILQTLFNMDDGRFQKVANVVGDAMKLHPHGDSSIFGALVNLANKGFLIDRQGNFGNIYTGDQAAAPRYIECRLSPLARETLFNKDLTEYVPSYDGRLQEPVTLPAKLPFLLLHGAEGIAVGMATKIMPHNFCELLEAQIKILKNESFEIYPDFPQGGLLDVSGYNHGNGRLKCRAKIVEANEKTIHIKEVPYGTTTESLIDSIEKATRAGKIKIVSINDYTAEEVEIEIKLARGVYAKDTIEALYAFSDCEIPISPNLMLIKDNTPQNPTVEEVLSYNTTKLAADLEKELEIELGRHKEKLHLRTLERIFIEERIYKRIEECTSLKAITDTVDQGLQPFTSELQRPVSREDIDHLLEIKIKRISLYDLQKQLKEIKEIKKAIKEVENHLKDMVSFTIKYLKKLLDKYGPLYPRRTTLQAFQEVEVRKVALSNLLVGYHRETGMLGHQVKTDCDVAIACSEYDRLLLIFRDGRFKVINVIDKMFVGHDLFWVDKVDEKIVFNLIYREGKHNVAYIKRFLTPKFILAKEYRLFPEHKKSWILFLQTGENVRARVDFMPQPRAKTNSMRVQFDDFLIKGIGAIGKRLSSRVVRRINALSSQGSEEEGKPVMAEQQNASGQADVSAVDLMPPVPVRQENSQATQLTLFQIKKKEKED